MTEAMKEKIKTLNAQLIEIREDTLKLDAKKKAFDSALMSFVTETTGKTGGDVSLVEILQGAIVAST